MWKAVRRWIWIGIPVAIAWVAWSHREALGMAAALIAGAHLVWLVGAAAAIAGVYLCRASVYRVPLRLFGYTTRLPFLWGTALTATSLHQLIPVGGAAGYAFLTYAMHQRGVAAGHASLVALVDTLSYAAAVATLVVSSLIYLALGGALYLPSLAAGFGVGLVLVAVAAWVYWLQRDRDRFVRLVLRAQRRVGAWLGRHWAETPVRAFLAEYYEGKRIIGRRPRAFARMMALQYLAVGCDAAALYLAFVALGRAPAPWTVLMGFVVAMSGMSVSGAPGGGGGFEALMSAVFAGQGVPLSQAIAGTILYRIVAFWIPVAISLVVVWNLRRKRRELRRTRTSSR